MPRKKSEPVDFINCANCGKTFLPSTWWQKYCSQDCNQLAYLKRKIERLQGKELDAAPKTTPSPDQEAEWKRRTEISKEQERKHLEEMIREAKLDKSSEKPDHLSMEEILYGKKDEGEKS